jgi:hypothetical protein
MRRPDGKINHAAMKLGDDLILVGYPGPKYKNPKRLGKTTPEPLHQCRRRGEALPTGKGRRRKFLKRRRISSTLTAGTAPQIPKDLSGISRRTFLSVRNQENSEEPIRNCREAISVGLDPQCTSLRLSCAPHVVHLGELEAAARLGRNNARA